ncbi:restriction endonuclease subunit S [Mycoplasma sp. 613B]
MSRENRWTLSNDTLLNYKLPIPPLDEQEKIANYLDWKINEINRLIFKEKEKIKQYTKLKSSLIYKKIYNFENSFVISLRKICEIIRGNTPFTKDDLKDKGQFVALQYGKVYKTNIIDDKYKFYVDSSFYNSNQIVKKNNIILISTSETIKDLGHVSFYIKEEDGLIGGEQILLKAKHNVFPKFLFYLIKSIKNKLQLCASGIKVYRFGINDLKNIKVSVPSLQKQKEISFFIDNSFIEIDKIIDKSKKLIDNLGLLKQSLIAEVVTGQKDIRHIQIPIYQKFDKTLILTEQEEEDKIND